MKMTVTLSPEYPSLRPWVESVPRLFDEGLGTLLYQGRNVVRQFETAGLQLVVKRFKRHDLLKAVAYSFWRKNKAVRSYENAALLRLRGFHSPHEIACIEMRSLGMLRQVYYICLYTDALPIRPLLIEQQSFDRPLATAYARYVARLHEAGVLHRDLNPTNVLFREHDGHYDFELIDINRMCFYDTPVPKAACMENLTLFYWLTPAYRYILSEYARQRGWTDADVAEAVRVKQRHDRHWIMRKQITHLGNYEVLH